MVTFIIKLLYSTRALMNSKARPAALDAVNTALKSSKMENLPKRKICQNRKIDGSHFDKNCVIFLKATRNIFTKKVESYEYATYKTRP